MPFDSEIKVNLDGHGHDADAPPLIKTVNGEPWDEIFDVWWFFSASTKRRGVRFVWDGKSEVFGSYAEWEDYVVHNRPQEP